MPDVAGEFPPELLDMAALERVVAFIAALPLTHAQKRRKLGDWALYRGVVLDSSYYRRVSTGPTPGL